MPTPDDAMVSPVEHESIASRATCPPEDARTTTAHDSHGSDDNGTRDRHGDSAHDVAMQDSTPPRQQSPANAQTLTDAHSKPAGADIETPNRDTPTPMTATDDGADEQRTSQTSPLSPTTPVSLYAHHLSSPFPAHRVCTTGFSDSMSEMDVG